MEKPLYDVILGNTERIQHPFDLLDHEECHPVQVAREKTIGKHREKSLSDDMIMVEDAPFKDWVAAKQVLTSRGCQHYQLPPLYILWKLDPKHFALYKERTLP